MHDDARGLARLVDPNIGGIGHLLTATDPRVLMPHGMIQVVPAVLPRGLKDQYLAERIDGVLVDVFEIGLGRDGRMGSDRDHDWEESHPFSYAVRMPTISARMGITASEHAAALRLEADRSGTYVLTIRAGEGASIQNPSAGSFSVAATSRGVRRYLWIESHEPGDAEWSDGCLTVRIRRERAGRIEWRIGLSYLGESEARQHVLAEVPWSLAWEAVEERAEAAWDGALGCIRVEGGGARERRIFYTGLYRVLSRMNDVSEFGRYFSAYDGRVHDDPTDFYVNDGLWDTYRVVHPLQLLMEPERHTAMLASYARMAEQSGRLPSFPRIEGDVPCMIGKHVISLMADAMAKGVDGLDWGTIYERLQLNLNAETRLPWRNGPPTAFDDCYRDHGFYPALGEEEAETIPEVHPFEGRQAVSVTLERAYDDWCLAQMARGLGKADDYARFMKRAENYRNLYNPEIGFMAPKEIHGRFIADFDPEYGGGQGGRRYFTEANAYVYTFHVQHDIDGLIGLMGGTARFIERLDQLFTIPPKRPKYQFLAQFPDSTGLMGQYPQGNEPSFHIPYLYNYAGAPAKTQRRVREIQRLWYGDGPLGVPGDEDGGAMSAWYVWSAIGLYPTCPGRPEYDLGSPLFERTVFHPPSGPTFAVTAEGVSDRAKYVASARLNGRALTAPRVSHDAWVKDGAELRLTMSVDPAEP